MKKKKKHDKIDNDNEVAKNTKFNSVKTKSLHKLKNIIQL